MERVGACEGIATRTKCICTLDTFKYLVRFPRRGVGGAVINRRFRVNYETTREKGALVSSSGRLKRQTYCPSA